MQNIRSGQNQKTRLHEELNPDHPDFVKIDDRTIGDGKVGPITNRLYETLHAKMPK